MGIWDSLKKGIETLIEDLNTPEPFKKGEVFEKYVRYKVFPDSSYKLIKKTQAYLDRGQDFAESDLEPDFKFRCLTTNREFFLEAKYRARFIEPLEKIFKPAQFERFKRINQITPVFIALGIAGKPESPKYLFVIPFSKIEAIDSNQESVENFEVKINFPYINQKLWSLVGRFCIRCKQAISLDFNKPLCKDCYKEWAIYQNVDYTEKYCHKCGTSAQTSYRKPLCLPCFKKEFSQHLLLKN